MVKQPQSKAIAKSSQTSDVFDISPGRVTIPPYQHVYCTVTFAPSAFQNYSAIVEVGEGLLDLSHIISLAQFFTRFLSLSR